MMAGLTIEVDKNTVVVVAERQWYW